MSKKPKKPEGGSNWMDTYGDMVTLLLCFFVLLYSMSTISAEKWEILVRSLNPDAAEISQVVNDISKFPGGEDTVAGGIRESLAEEKGVEESIEEELSGEDDFDRLYRAIKQSVKEQSLESEVEVHKGDGYTFITFRDNVFFDGDSYILKPEGATLLDSICVALVNASDSIQEIQIYGHTTQARPDKPNNVREDRFLSGNRANEVLVYIQNQVNGVITPDKLIACGFGQFRPIASFDTEEERAKNRRVELLVSKNDTIIRSLDEYYEEVYEEE